MISTNSTTAQQQGTSSADAAAKSAGGPGGLGIVGKIIYLDIEQYALSSSLTACAPAVIAFLNGWINEIHTDGYLAGIYGSPIDAANWYTNLSTLPEDVWIAKDDTRATIWSLGYGLNDVMWNTNQRIHQYVGTHSETWGGTTFTKIDNDIEDAGIIGGLWNKTHTYSYTGFDCGLGTFPQDIGGITQSGQTPNVVGYDLDVDGIPHGFSYLGSVCVQIDYPGAVRTIVTGVNNAGQIVGYYEDQSSVWHGFLNGGGSIDYPGARDTYAIGINDDNQVTGYYEDSSGNYHGFLQNAGQFYTFDYQGAVGATTVGAINGVTQIAGTYGDTNSQGFTLSLTPPLWTPGSFHAVSYPGSSDTNPMGMNNNGQVVGAYLDANNVPFSFLYDSNTNSYMTISNAGWFELALNGINDAAEMTGYYEDSQGYHGFIAIPQ